MKKILTITVLGILLTSCQNSNSNNEQDTKIKELEDKIEKLTSENTNIEADKEEITRLESSSEPEKIKLEKEIEKPKTVKKSSIKIPSGWKVIKAKMPDDGCEKTITKITVNLNNDGIDDYVISIEKGETSKVVAFISIENSYKMINVDSYANSYLAYNSKSKVLSNYSCESGGNYYKWNGSSFNEHDPYQ